MPVGKTGSNLRQIKQWQRDAARAEYLRHPDASIADVAKATNVGPRTVARARAQLVKEGLLAQGRNATTNGADAAVLAVAAKEAFGDESSSDPVSDDTGQAPEPDKPPAHVTVAVKARGSTSGETIDGQALRELNAMLDDIADEDDDLTRKRMLRQVKKFAFDPTLHPDTRMSASQLWAKLLDMQRAKDLGPGKPRTIEEAIARATDFLRTCGPKVAVPAFYAAFDLGDPNEASNDQAPAADGTPSSASAAGHEGGNP